LVAEGFAAVLVAVGLEQSLALPGARRPRAGVIGALEFLAEVKRAKTTAGKVLVLGGGNSAIDAAMAAKQAGADTVGIVYRRSFAEMPAWPQERDKAIQAGVNFLTLTAPLDYQTDAAGKLTGLKVARTELGPLDAKGRRRPVLLPGTEHVLPADLVVEAIGQQAPDELKAALPGLRFTEEGLIWVRGDTLETSRPGIFAAGDIINGGTTVMRAVAEGTRAAREINQFLSKGSTLYT
jgi:NADPH-dependent glutamate synthase beta subunit-like oxidoreductase